MSVSYVERKSVIITQNRRSLTKKLPDRALPCLSSARLAPNEEVEFRVEDMQAPTITVTLTTTAGGEADTLLARQAHLLLRMIPLSPLLFRRWHLPKRYLMTRTT